MDTYNPELDPKKDHKRQSIWQIWVPLGAAILAFLAVAVLIILTTGTHKSEFSLKWSSISLIYMIIPALLLCFILLAILAGLIFGIAKLTGLVPQWTGTALYYLKFAAEKIRYYSNKLITPIYKAHQFSAGFSALRKRLGL